jgi:formate hydrogenlyase transcriptional activator
VIAATNRNLVEAVREGRFRADLYYRLNVVPLRVPPLRERREDIAPLAMYLLARAARKTGKGVHGIATHTLAQLQGYDFPGNIRELENIIERAVVLSAGPVLAIDLGLSMRAQGPGTARSPVKEPGIEPRPGMLERAIAPAATSPASARDESSMDDIQRAHIQGVLRRTGGVVEGPNGAAMILGMHPNTLRSRMKKLGLTAGSVRSRA